MALETCGSWGKEMDNSWKSVSNEFVIVCDYMERWLKHLMVYFVVSLFY
jgi:hypothetical protein